MKFKFLIIMLIFLFFIGNVQASAPEWDRTFGGIANDSAADVEQISEGGFIIAGSTDSYGAGNSDVWIIKTDEFGNWSWDRTFGGIDNDSAADVEQTSEGGFIIAGSTNSYGAGNSDAWIIKTDAKGNWLWDKPYGGRSNDYAASVQQTLDGGYIYAGTTFSYGAGSSDVWVLKTDSNGTRIWDKTFGGKGDESGASVQETSDGGYIIGATSFKEGSIDSNIWLIKTDSNGKVLWDRSFGGPKNDSASAARETTDGGYIIVGTTLSYSAGGSDIWLIKMDNKGNRLWDKTLGGKNNDSAAAVRQTEDGGYVIAGTTSTYGTGISDAWLIKTDSEGNWQWDKTFGGNNTDSGASVQQISKNEYILAGSTFSYGAGGSDIWLIDAIEEVPLKKETSETSPAPRTPTSTEKSVQGFEILMTSIGLFAALIIAYKLKKY